MGGELLFQTVAWPRWIDRIGAGGLVGSGWTSPLDTVPTPSGRPLAAIRWRGRDLVELVGIEPSAGGAALRPGESWAWSDGPISVDLDLVAPGTDGRAGGPALMDPAFAGMVLMLSVGVSQAMWLGARISSAAEAAAAQAPDPTPELIARLLERDLDGADEGLSERVERAEREQQNQSFYLPAGNEGPMRAAGGGAAAGDEVSREEPVEGADDPPAPEAPPAPPDPPLPGEAEALELPEAPPAPDELLGDPEAPEEPPEDDQAPATPDPMERFVGWGFKDWFDVEDARPEDERRWARELDLARTRLRLDPDDPYALNVVGLYAYLAQNNALARQTYERMLELHPDDPTAYNNYGLILKREGRYAEEEALYRQALALDPDDTHVLNNLAVNLAHQGRFDEALAVMDRLEQIDPEDVYAELHRAKIYAAMGKERRALKHLERALAGAAAMDTLHHIEFRQDLRLDPVFAGLRGDERFRALLRDAYGREAEYLLGSGGRGQHAPGGSSG
jgi:tetratricopeptide (TPR) repeat protein